LADFLARKSAVNLFPRANEPDPLKPVFISVFQLFSISDFLGVWSRSVMHRPTTLLIWLIISHILPFLNHIMFILNNL
jgi:hypothetical protein